MDPFKLIRSSINNWAVDRKFSRVGGIRTVVIGDSLSALSKDVDLTGGVQFVFDDASGIGYYVSGAGARINTADYGAFTWADALMGAPHNIVSNSGIGGNNSDQVLARFATDCLNLRPDLVYLWIGRNDFKQGRSFEYVRDNWIKLLDQLASILAFVCAIDVPPSADLSSVPGAAREAAKFNNWLRAEVTRRRSMALVSASSVMIDPNVAQSGAAKANMVMDGTHNNNLGAMVVGQAIARVMGPIVRQWDYPIAPTDGWDFVNSDAPEIRSSNPLFAGTTGVAGAGVTGQVATNWEVQVSGGSPTVAASKSTDRENVGEAQRLAMTFQAANEVVTLGVTGSVLGGNVAGRFVPGKLIEAQCDIVFDAASAAILNRLELVISATFNGVGRQVSAMRRVVSSNDAGVAANILPLPLGGKILRLRTPRALLPAPCTLLQYFLRFGTSGAGTVTADVSRFAVRQSAIG